MPLTPRFEISQNASEVLVTISVPSGRISNDNIEILLDDEAMLHFYASPYLLKLNFSPNEFSPEAEGAVSARYDPLEQTVAIPLKKKVPNVDWPNLELTARLLEPTEIPAQWLHSVQENENGSSTAWKDNHNNNNHSDDNDNGSDNGSDRDSDNQTLTASGFGYGYGFGSIFQNIFVDYCRSGLAAEMLQLPEPETTPSEERRRLRLQKETQDFDPDRYLQDFMSLQEDYLYPMVMQFLPFWRGKQPTKEVLAKKTTTKETTPPSTTSDGQDTNDLATTLETNLYLSSDPLLPRSPVRTMHYFTSDEKLQLSTLPYPLIPKKFITDQYRQHQLAAGLLDLVVPFVYDHLTTMGDPTVESAWTITALSCSLSWLDPPNTIQDAVVALNRRMLLYPYWRNWDFCLYVWKHTLQLFQSGIHRLIQSLLRIRIILDKSESYYLGNKLFVDPYLYWMQNSVHVRTICQAVASSLQNALEKSDRLKENLGLDLLRYEAMLEVDKDDSSGRDEEDDDDSVGEDESNRSSDCDDDSADDDDSTNEDASESFRKQIGKEGRFGDNIAQKDANKGSIIDSRSLLDAEVEKGMSLLNIVGQGATMSSYEDSKKDLVPSTEIHTKQAVDKKGRNTLIVEIER